MARKQAAVSAASVKALAERLAAPFDRLADDLATIDPAASTAARQSAERIRAAAKFKEEE